MYNTALLSAFDIKSKFENSHSGTGCAGCMISLRMEIRIHVPRPLTLLSIAVVGVLFWSGVLSLHLPSVKGDLTAQGGGAQTAALISGATADIDRQRVTQAVLEKQEEILRYQMSLLEAEALKAQTPEAIAKVGQTRAVLLSIIKQRANSEKLLRLSLEQLWDAEGSSFSLARLDTDTELDWPVEPKLGISAFFEDAGYKDRFGVDHHAIDIPASQRTPIRAPADGTVAKVAMNGLGYSFIVLSHDGDLQTIFGHVTDATVQEGDTVTFGQIIGHTGGEPGTLGAGLLTTGPHLHFAVRVKGTLVDPLQYLPKLRGISTEPPN